MAKRALRCSRRRIEQGSLPHRFQKQAVSYSSFCTSVFNGPVELGDLTEQALDALDIVIAGRFADSAAGVQHVKGVGAFQREIIRGIDVFAFLDQPAALPLVIIEIGKELLPVAVLKAVFGMIVFPALIDIAVALIGAVLIARD